MSKDTKVMAVINPVISGKEETELTERFMEHFPISFQIIKDVKELFPLLSNPYFICDYIAIDLQELYSISNVDVFAVLNTLSTLLTCSTVRDENEQLIPRNAEIIVLVGTKTPPELIKEIMGLSMVSYIGLRAGDGFTYDEIAASLSTIMARDNTLPPQIQDMLSKKRKNNKSQNSINLTPRQRQIFNLVANRGASNKVIAKMLNISESTVKLHMGALLKKYKVRNRTQLAVFAKDNSNETPMF